MGGKQCSVTHRNDAAAVHRSIKQFVLHPLPDISNVTPVHKASVVNCHHARSCSHRPTSLRQPPQSALGRRKTSEQPPAHTARQNTPPRWTSPLSSLARHQLDRDLPGATASTLVNPPAPLQGRTNRLNPSPPPPRLDHGAARDTTTPRKIPPSTPRANRLYRSVPACGGGE